MTRGLNFRILQEQWKGFLTLNWNFMGGFFGEILMCGLKRFWGPSCCNEFPPKFQLKSSRKNSPKNR